MRLLPLCVGGDFITAGGVPAPHIARWDGVAFTSLGGGLLDTTGNVTCFAVHDLGTGDGYSSRSAARPRPSRVERSSRCRGSVRSSSASRSPARWP